MFGLPKRAVELVPHDPRWAGQADFEEERLRSVLGEVLLAVHHIGSTAIPGIVAKPILDLMPVVHDLAAFDRAASAIEAIGYRMHGENRIQGRRYCTVDAPAQGRCMVHAHIFAEDDQHIVRHLAFRNYMREHPSEARLYESEKMRCRDLYPDESGAYSSAKSAWVMAAEQRALAWYGGGTIE
jgi:GrpB-like predicted nucleotidyltransferase (UPF0157 family)